MSNRGDNGEWRALHFLLYNLYPSPDIDSQGDYYIYKIKMDRVGRSGFEVTGRYTEECKSYECEEMKTGDHETEMG